MKPNGWRALIVLFWLVMMGWLIRYEAFPHWFTRAYTGGYRTLLSRGPLVMDSWMRILFKGQPIGYSHTWVDSQTESAAEAYTVKNDTRLNLKLMGLSQWVTISAGATLDATYRLQAFSATMGALQYTTALKGRRIGQETFAIEVDTPSGARSMTLAVPDDAILYSPMTEMAVRDLKPGQSLRLRVLDPLSLSVSDVTAEALRREPLARPGGDVPATVLKLTFRGMESLAWIDADGQTLREDTPFGWSLIACTATEAMESLDAADGAEDLLSATAIPCRGTLSRPRACRALTLLLRGGGLSSVDLVGPRQSVDRQTAETARADAGPPQTVRLTVSAPPPPVQSPAYGTAWPTNLAPYLAPSAAIQSDHPDLQQQARAIVAGASNSWHAARAIGDWVFRHVEKQPTVSLPSALDVWRQRVGDCNEHTYLFVALARAAGLPAQIKVGIVYSEAIGPQPAFFYHAWPAVYVGEWVEMDPTLGQDTVDATHVALAAGELADQIKLLAVFGQLSAEIVAAEP